MTDDLSLILKALVFAAHKHRDQRRKDAEASPYINHPIALADILVNEGEVRDVSVLCAAILHDTIEDTECTAEELKREFGTKIRDIVLEVTEDMTIPKPERKRQEVEHAKHLSPEASLVKLADKISNVRDLLRSRPLTWSDERREAYYDHALEVVSYLTGINPLLERAFERAMAQRGHHA